MPASWIRPTRSLHLKRTSAQAVAGRIFLRRGVARRPTLGTVDGEATSLNRERIVALAQHMRASGRSLRQIVVELRDMGVVNRRGRPLSLSYVFKLVRAVPSAGRGVPSRDPAACDQAQHHTPDERNDSEPELPFTD